MEILGYSDKQQHCLQSTPAGEETESILGAELVAQESRSENSVTTVADLTVTDDLCTLWYAKKLQASPSLIADGLTCRDVSNIECYLEKGMPKEVTKDTLSSVLATNSIYASYIRARSAPGGDSTIQVLEEIKKGGVDLKKLAILATKTSYSDVPDLCRDEVENDRKPSFDTKMSSEQVDQVENGTVIEDTGAKRKREDEVENDRKRSFDTIMSSEQVDEVENGTENSLTTSVVSVSAAPACSSANDSDMKRIHDSVEHEIRKWYDAGKFRELRDKVKNSEGTFERNVRAVIQAKVAVRERALTETDYFSTVWYEKELQSSSSLTGEGLTCRDVSNIECYLEKRMPKVTKDTLSSVLATKSIYARYILALSAPGGYSTIKVLEEMKKGGVVLKNLAIMATETSYADVPDLLRG